MQKDFKLIQTEKGLSLQNPNNQKIKPIIIDFASGKSEHRRKFGGGLGQHISKAVGVKGNYKPYVIDATAGMGRDSFVLATLGCKVLMLERNKTIFKLLQDGLERGSESEEIAEIIGRMKVINTDAIDYIGKISDNEKPDVIYLDPMFPHSKKSRLVKKEMRIFRELVGDDLDAEKLLKISLSKAKKRIVVKRPAKSEFLGGLEPNFQIKGRVNRFDVYLPK
jgi:16S rRNA (guanine1516-N2)-methyltransferase